MIIPLAEECVSFKKVGLIGTTATVSSGAYERELKKRAPSVHLYSVATPLLVPLIENGELSLATETARKYLAPLTAKKIDALILGCTHYPIIKNRIKKILPEGVRIISQDTVVPKKLREYLARHPEMEKRLSKKGRRVFAVTDVTPTLSTLAQKWFGAHVKIQKVSIGN